MMGEKRKLAVEVSSDDNRLNWSSAVGNKMRSDHQFSSQSWINSHPSSSSSIFPVVHCGGMKKMIYCFICGNATCEGNTTVIHSRQQGSSGGGDSPFFPFMEYHDPAPGADPMNNWSVLSCFVCNAFLLQQWHSFERYKTPINKRLYWLKRPSGCEIRQPVSQIELEEMLNENVRDDGQGGDLSDHNTEIQPPTTTTTTLPKPLKSETTTTTTTQQTTTRSESPTTSPTTNDPTTTTSLPMVNCYCCGEGKQLNLEVCRIYIRPSYEQMRVGVPYYPTTLKHPISEHAQIIHNSITFMCISCLPRFPPHWHQLQKDFLKQFNNPPHMLPRIPLPEMVSCYMCQQMVDTKYNDHLVNLTSPGVLRKLLESKQSAMNRPLSVPLKFDFTYLCHDCMTSVKKECGDVIDDKKHE